MVRRVLCYAWPEPTWLDSALRTTPDTPTIGAYPRKSGVQLRIADNPRCTHDWCTPIKSPRRNHPAGRDLPTRGHIGRGDSSNDDAYCGTKVEYRTSSTPAYTDRLDLHYSTNNAPTKTWGRARLRIADNPRCTHDWCAPTNSAPGPHQNPHCGQPQPDPSLAHAHECLARHSQRRYPTNRRVIDQSPRPNSPPPETEALELHEGVLGLLQELAFLAGAL